MLVNFVQGEVVVFKRLALGADPSNNSQSPMRHDHHHHAVRVFQFGVFGELNDGVFNRL